MPLSRLHYHKEHSDPCHVSQVDLVNGSTKVLASYGLLSLQHIFTSPGIAMLVFSISSITRSVLPTSYIFITFQWRTVFECKER